MTREMEVATQGLVIQYSDGTRPAASAANLNQTIYNTTTNTFQVSERNSVG